jgi:hypothetical protein
MKWYEAAGIGTIMACLYGVTLWASLQVKVVQEGYWQGAWGGGTLNWTDGNFQYVTPEVYKNTPIPNHIPDISYVPFEITGAVMLAAFIILFSTPLWCPVVEQWIQETGERIAEGKLK